MTVVIILTVTNSANDVYFANFVTVGIICEAIFSGKIYSPLIGRFVFWCETEAAKNVLLINMN